MGAPIIWWHEKEKEVEKELRFEIIPIAIFQLSSYIQISNRLRDEWIKCSKICLFLRFFTLRRESNPGRTDEVDGISTKQYIELCWMGGGWPLHGHMVGQQLAVASSWVSRQPWQLLYWESIHAMPFHCLNYTPRYWGRQTKRITLRFTPSSEWSFMVAESYNSKNLSAIFRTTQKFKKVGTLNYHTWWFQCFCYDFLIILINKIEQFLVENIEQLQFSCNMSEWNCSCFVDVGRKWLNLTL